MDIAELGVKLDEEKKEQVRNDYALLKALLCQGAHASANAALCIYNLIKNVVFFTSTNLNVDRLMPECAENYILYFVRPNSSHGLNK